MPKLPSAPRRRRNEDRDTEARRVAEQGQLDRAIALLEYEARMRRLAELARITEDTP